MWEAVTLALDSSLPLWSVCPFISLALPLPSCCLSLITLSLLSPSSCLFLHLFPTSLPLLWSVCSEMTLVTIPSFLPSSCLSVCHLIPYPPPSEASPTISPYFPIQPLLSSLWPFHFNTNRLFPLLCLSHLTPVASVYPLSSLPCISSSSSSTFRPYLHSTLTFGNPINHS